MRTWTTFTRMFVTACILSSILWFNVGTLRCESPPGGPGNLEPQAKSDNPVLEKNRERGWLEDREQKHERFKVLEWLIKQQLLSQYQQMEIREELGD